MWNVQYSCIPTTGHISVYDRIIFIYWVSLVNYSTNDACAALRDNRPRNYKSASCCSLTQLYALRIWYFQSPHWGLYKIAVLVFLLICTKRGIPETHIFFLLINSWISLSVCKSKDFIVSEFNDFINNQLFTILDNLV